MKDIRVVGIAVFGALAFAAFTAKADTVVWYDFDGLGEAGTTVSHGTTIQNKASPGTLDATVIGIHNGHSAKTENTEHMPASAVGYPVGQRISDPVSGAMATSADGAIKFTSPAASSDSRAFPAPRSARHPQRRFHPRF